MRVVQQTLSADPRKSAVKKPNKFPRYDHMQKPIEVCIISGYLGAGKTTLLNHMLRVLPDRSPVVIENELGDLPLDGSLIERKQSQVIELTHGCICCTLDHDLKETLADIIRMRREKEIDLLIIEATGTADPGNIAALFMQPQLQQHFDLLSCICIVDAETIRERLDQVEEAVKQVTFATDIILNKTADQKPEDIDGLHNLMQSINPFAEITESEDGSADIQQLMRPKVRNNQQAEIATEHKHGHHHSVNVIPYSNDDPCDLSELIYQIQSLLLLYNHQIYRIKGVVQAHDGKMYLIQSAGKHVNHTRLPEWGLESRASRLVFIGKELQKKTINRVLRKPFKRVLV